MKVFSHHRFSLPLILHLSLLAMLAAPPFATAQWRRGTSGKTDGIGRRGSESDALRSQPSDAIGAQQYDAIGAQQSEAIRVKSDEGIGGTAGDGLSDGTAGDALGKGMRTSGLDESTADGSRDQVSDRARYPVGIGGAILLNSGANDGPSGTGQQNPSLSDLRNQQQAELDDLRGTYDQRARKECPKNPDGTINTKSPEYQKLKQEYTQKHTQVRDKYTAQDPRVSEYTNMDKKGGVKSTGSAQKDVRADGDLTPQSEADFNKKQADWQNRGDKVVDKGHKVVNETTDETMWKNDPKGQHSKAKIQDPDAVGTAGGRKSVGDNAGGITDAEGMTLDHEKKYLDGKQRGNLKDQAKAVTKAGETTGTANQNPEFYDKAKKLKNYGDDVTAGISELGDSPEVRQKKIQDWQNQADAEMGKIKQAGAEQGARTQGQRQQIADQAKAAENAGDKDWAEAKKKANYGDQKTTSEAIEDRIKTVKEGNAAAAEQNKGMRDKMNKGPNADPDGPGGTRVTDADGPGARPAPDADGPGGVAKGTPPATRGAKIKAAAGTAMAGVQIMNTAQDIKEVLTSDDPAAEAKKKALQQFDGMTGDVRNKGSDYSDAKENTDRANQMNQQAYQTQLENKLRRMGVDPKEAGQLAKDYAAGNTKGYEDRMQEQTQKGVRDPKGDKMPERPKTETVTGDDTAGDRAADLAKGMAHGAVRAGTFVKDAVSDTAEIGAGLTEKGVAEELVNQKKESYNNWQDKRKNEQAAAESDKTARNNAEDIYNKLRARGASDIGARNAADALAKGNPAPLHDLLANLNEKKRLKEAESKGAGDGSNGSAPEDGSALDKITGAQNQKNAGKTRAAMGNMSAHSQMAQGSTAGDQEAKDARNKINQAGNEAQDKQDQTSKQVAAGDRKDALGNKLKDAVADGLAAGGAAAGKAVGGAAADKTTGAIFGDKNPSTPDGKPDGAKADSGVTASGSGKPVATTQGGGKGGGGGGRKTKPDSDGQSSGGKEGGEDSKDKPMVTCPGCGKTFAGIAGQGVECPNCVTMTCPRCGHSKNYPRGQEPESCPMCYTITCNLCGSTGYARRDQPAPQCPNCVRVRCSGCGSLLYEGSEASKPASLVCNTCTERAAAAASAAASEGGE